MGLKDLFAAHAEGTGSQVEEHTIDVQGMHCNACERRVCNALEERGARNVVAHHETGKVTYVGTLDEEVVSEAIRVAGFSLA